VGGTPKLFLSRNCHILNVFTSLRVERASGLLLGQIASGTLAPLWRRHLVLGAVWSDEIQSKTWAGAITFLIVRSSANS